MPKDRADEWKRKTGGVCWTDIWAWLAEIRDEYGLWGQVTLHPPMPSQKDQRHGQAVLQLKRYYEGGEAVKLTRWVMLPDPSRARAEDVVLQLVASVSMQLDREAYEAERAAVQGGLPF